MLTENGKLWFSWFTSLWLSATTGRGPLPATFQSYKSIIILLWWGFIMLRNDFILLSLQIPLNHSTGWFLFSQRTHLMLKNITAMMEGHKVLVDILHQYWYFLEATCVAHAKLRSNEMLLLIQSLRASICLSLINWEILDNVFICAVLSQKICSLPSAATNKLQSMFLTENKIFVERYFLSLSSAMPCHWYERLHDLKLDLNK